MSNPTTNIAQQGKWIAPAMTVSLSDLMIGFW